MGDQSEDQRLEALRALRLEGLSYRAIAERAGLSKTHVQRLLKDFAGPPVKGRDGKVYGRGTGEKKPPTPRQKKPPTPPQNTVFGCLDGETIEDCYCILGTENATLSERGRGLDGWAIFDWILDQGVREMWGYALTYDVNHWLKNLSGEIEVKQEVLDEDGEPTGETERVTLPAGVYVARLLHESEHNTARINRYECGVNRTYALQHIYGKLFRISRWETAGMRTVVHRDGEESRAPVRENMVTVWIWDAFAFAGGGSFANWVEGWDLAQSEDELAWLREMKASRADFTWSDFDRVLEYNRLEMQLLRRGVEKLKRLAQGLDLEPRKWYSPGSLAAAAFDRHGIRAHLGRELLDDEGMLERVQAAYFGGRMEVGILGQIEGPIYHADIHSAYPAEMVKLPSLAGAEWEPIDGWEPGDGLALLRVSWAADPDHRFAPFPVRPGAGSIRYPLESGGDRWLWSVEVEAGLKVPGVDLEIYGGYGLRLASEDRPFGWLGEYYERRRALKAAGDDREYMLKLVINSAYGKTAQRPHGDGVPPFYQPIYAGLITAGCRARLLEVYARHPDLIAFATDGITSREPLDLDYGPGLGQWELAVLDWIFYGQVGVYYYPGPNGIESRTRGFGRRAIPYADVIKAWRAGQPLIVADQRLIGYRIAFAYGDRQGADWGKIMKVERKVKITGKPRRRDGERVGDMLYTKPPVRSRAGRWDAIMSEAMGPLDYELLERADQYDTFHEYESGKL